MSALPPAPLLVAKAVFAAYTARPSDHHQGIERTVRGLDHVEQPHSVLLQLFLVSLLSQGGGAWSGSCSQGRTCSSSSCNRETSSPH